MKFIGAAELAGAIGLVLPALLGGAEWLAPVAATGLAVTMFLAIVTHVRRHETAETLMPAALLVASVVVAWGRFGPYAF